MKPALSAGQDDTFYQALKSRDARFDGSFFTGVTSTGIYCRPVCKVRLPRRENCVFFSHAAQAERAGFRPCLRCRPELAPHAIGWSIQDASAILAQQAARLLDTPEAWEDWPPTLAASRAALPPEGARSALGRPGGTNVAPTLAASRAALPPEGARSALGRPGGRTSAPTIALLAARLGVSDRHVRRLFETHLGVSPVQYLQTRRLLSAKQLLADTALPVAQIAFICGYASVRRFNAAFTGHYQLNPTQLRRSGALPGRQGACIVKLGYRPPYDVLAMLGFFRKRQITGLEAVDADGAGLARTLVIEHGGRRFFGWLSARFDTGRHQVELQVADSLREVLPGVIHRVRALLDLDADPGAINARLHASFPAGDGLRVPGALSGFEVAVRAVLGQQVTVAAARTLAQRLVERFGERIETPFPALTHLFPGAQVLAAADGDALGQLGIVRQRQQAILALARAVVEGRLALHGGVDVAATVAALKELPGIGDWTAQYIAMRALRWPDAFPAGDVALHKALGVLGDPQPARAAQAASQAWRPWRSYAVVRAWAGAGAPRETAVAPSLDGDPGTVAPAKMKPSQPLKTSTLAKP